MRKILVIFSLFGLAACSEYPIWKCEDLGADAGLMLQPDLWHHDEHKHDMTVITDMSRPLDMRQDLSMPKDMSHDMKICNDMSKPPVDMSKPEDMCKPVDMAKTVDMKKSCSYDRWHHCNDEDDCDCN